jgi:hypothetical protein
VARQLAAALDARRQEYALGGAIALGYWAAPRGTVDVDLTLFLSPDKLTACVWLLQDLGCKLTASNTHLAFLRSLFAIRTQRVSVLAPSSLFRQRTLHPTR